jgi:abortive infection bacteriophage resistance protein
MKKATTVDQQIELLKKRGVIINDDTKVKEILLDIGYYRRGFYWFPYEINFYIRNLMLGFNR